MSGSDAMLMMTVIEKITDMAGIVRSHGKYTFSFEADLPRDDVSVGRITGSRTSSGGVQWSRSYLDNGKWWPEEVIPVDLLVDYVAWLLDFQAAHP